MQIMTKEVELTVDGSPMRVYLAAPKPAAKYPGVILYSEIFQLTGPIRRSVERLAGHGFIVAAPEIYHRLEKPGTVIPYDDHGRTWGNEDAKRTEVAEFDRDARAVLDLLCAHPQCSGALCSMGFCIGGHLALRAALNKDVQGAVCCYPTGVHNGKLGKDSDAGTLARLKEIRGDLLIVFGDADPHVPPTERKVVLDALRAAGVRHTTHIAAGEHAFMRDEGPRYDSAAADDVWARAVQFLKNCALDAPTID